MSDTTDAATKLNPLDEANPLWPWHVRLFGWPDLGQRVYVEALDVVTIEQHADEGSDFLWCTVSMKNGRCVSIGHKADVIAELVAQALAAKR